MLFVGTHQDLVSKEEFSRKDKLLQKKIEHTNNINEDQLMLPVDNLNGNEDEIDMIKSILEKIIKRSFDKVTIPASWMMLYLCIRNRRVKTMHFNECAKLANN